MNIFDWLFRRQSQTAAPVIDPVYGSVVQPGSNALGTNAALPNAGLPGNGGSYFADAKPFNYAGLASQGVALMAAGQAPPQQNMQVMPPAPVHRPDAGVAGLLTAIFPPAAISPADDQAAELKRRRRLAGLSGLLDPMGE